MKIRREMEEKYRGWLEKRRNDPHGHLMVSAMHSAGDCLDENGSAEDALHLVLQLKRSLLSIENRVQIALAASIFSERGDEFRFAWNKYYRGEDWALGMEMSEKRLFNPS